MAPGALVVNKVITLAGSGSSSGMNRNSAEVVPAAVACLTIVAITSWSTGGATTIRRLLAGSAVIVAPGALVVNKVITLAGSCSSN